MPFKSPPSQFPSAMDLTLPRIQPERTRKNPKVRYTHVYNFLYNFISTQFPRADVPVSSLSLSLFLDNSIRPRSDQLCHVATIESAVFGR
jgi:hypothetical protein